VRFLVDNAVSPSVAAGLLREGHDALHIRDRGLANRDDELLFELAARENRILISADTDFATLLALRRASKPSVILFRHRAPRRPEEQLRLLLAQLSQLSEPLEQGSLVSIEDARVRVRLLPLIPRQ
jgi:predicted nuclease of predicted toxin-antitoxin system